MLFFIFVLEPLQFGQYVFPFRKKLPRDFPGMLNLDMFYEKLDKKTGYQADGCDSESLQEFCYQQGDLVAIQMCGLLMGCPWCLCNRKLHLNYSYG